MVVQPATAIQGPQLSAIRSADPAAATEAITRLLKYVDSMFNFAEHKKLNTLQAAMLANDIAQRYWQLKFDEVVYVLREGANGRYHTFDRIDPGVIHGWFAEYQIERDALVEHLAHNQMIADKQATELANTNIMAYLHNQPQIEAARPDMHRTYTYMALKARTSEELQQGVAYYTRHPDAPEAELKRQVAEQLLAERKQEEVIAAARINEQRTKARALIAEYDAVTLPTPEIEVVAAQHFAAQRGLPKLSDARPPVFASMQVVGDANPTAA